MSYKNTQRWRAKAKRWLIRYGGGKCQVCDYDKWFGNLAWHHVRDKKFDISRMLNSCNSWDSILTETDKCVMVCHNCHGEIHAGIVECPSIDLQPRKKILAEILSERPIPKNQKVHNCICGRQTSLRNKYCSQKCAHKDAERIKWPDNLAELVWLKPTVTIASELGITDKAIEKRCKRLGISKPGPGYWKAKRI